MKQAMRRVGEVVGLYGGGLYLRAFGGRVALGGARTVHHHMAIGAWAKRWAGGMKKVFYFLKDLEAG